MAPGRYENYIINFIGKRSLFVLKNNLALAIEVCIYSIKSWIFLYNNIQGYKKRMKK